MKYKYVTFVGPDTKTDLEQMLELSKKHPFIEWGFNYDWQDDHSVDPQYMSVLDILSFMKPLYEQGANVSLHLSGEAVYNLIVFGMKLCMSRTNALSEAQQYSEINSLLLMLELSSRVQISIPKNNDKLNITPHMLGQASLGIMQGIAPIQIVVKCDDDFDSQFVLDATNAFKQTNIAILFTDQTAPIPGILCGYSRAISTSNVRSISQLISKDVPKGFSYINIVDKVRTDGLFDLAKVKKVIGNIPAKYI